MIAISPSHPSTGLSVAARARFARMVPAIRREGRLALRRLEPSEREGLVAEVIATARDIFARLAERGLGDLAYPRPLAMAALVSLGLDPADLGARGL